MIFGSAFLFAVGEEGGSTIEQLAFPMTDLSRMDVEARGELLRGLDAFEGFQGDLRFELEGMLLAFCHCGEGYGPLPTGEKSVLHRCPNFGVHYRAYG